MYEIFGKILVGCMLIGSIWFALYMLKVAWDNTNRIDRTILGTIVIVSTPVVFWILFNGDVSHRGLVIVGLTLSVTVIPYMMNIIQYGWHKAGTPKQIQIICLMVNPIALLVLTTFKHITQK